MPLAKELFTGLYCCCWLLCCIHRKLHFSHFLLVKRKPALPRSSCRPATKGAVCFHFHWQDRGNSTPFFGLHAHAHVYSFKHTCAYTQTHTYTLTSIYIQIYMCIHTHSYTHTHIQTHTCTPISSLLPRWSQGKRACDNPHPRATVNNKEARGQLPVFGGQLI